MFTVDKSKKIHEQITEDTWGCGWFWLDSEGDWDETEDVNDLGHVPKPSGDYPVCACALGWVALRYPDEYDVIRKRMASYITNEDVVSSVEATQVVAEYNDAGEFSSIKQLFEVLDL